MSAELGISETDMPSSADNNMINILSRITTTYCVRTQISVQAHSVWIIDITFVYLAVKDNNSRLTIIANNESNSENNNETNNK